MSQLHHPPALYLDSLQQCISSFQSPSCYESYLLFFCNLIIFGILSLVVYRRLKFEGVYRIPKTKTSALILLWMALANQLIFEIWSQAHWAYYAYILFDYEYFVFVIYFFGKKILKAWDRQERLKYYKILTACIIFCFVANFTYSNAVDLDQRRDLCSYQYTYIRFVGLILEIILTLIGYYLNKGLIKKLEETKNKTLYEKARLRMEKTKQQVQILSKLIIIFMLSQILLIGRALFFRFNPSFHCTYFPHKPIFNTVTSLIVQGLSNILPKIYTIVVFTRQASHPVSNNLQIELMIRTREESRQIERITMTLRKESQLEEASTFG